MDAVIGGRQLPFSIVRLAARLCGSQKTGRVRVISGAGGRTRTDDLLITNQLLYQLSYAGKRQDESAARNAGR